MYNKIILLQKGETNMTGIYFSGTGNTRYCMEQFVSNYDDAVDDFVSDDRLKIEKNY